MFLPNSTPACPQWLIYHGCHGNVGMHQYSRSLNLFRSTTQKARVGVSALTHGRSVRCSGWHAHGRGRGHARGRRCPRLVRSRGSRRRRHHARRSRRHGHLRHGCGAQRVESVVIIKRRRWSFERLCSTSARPCSNQLFLHDCNNNNLC